MSANNKQIGGDHYQSQFQHWDLVGAIPLGYLEGQITKYVARNKRKNGVEDLRKAQHFLDKLIETTNYDVKRNLSKDEIKKAVSEFADVNHLDILELVFIYLLCTYTKLADLETAHTVLSRLITEAVIDDLKA